jgi:hypothetical protein
MGIGRFEQLKAAGFLGRGRYTFSRRLSMRYSAEWIEFSLALLM